MHRHRSFTFRMFAAIACGVVAGSVSASRAEPCGTVVGAGTMLVLAGNVGPCDDDVAAAIVVESGATLDLDGHAVFCADMDADTSLPDGIRMTGAKAIVRGGGVVGCRVGLAVAGEGRHSIEQVTTESNATGMRVETASVRNRIEACASVDNAGDGFLFEGDRTSVTDSFASGNTIGFRVQSSRNRLKNSHSTEHLSGIDVDGADNKLSLVTSSHNDYGLRCRGEGCRIVEFGAVENTVEALSIESSAKVKSSAFSSNQVGIHVYASAAQVKIVGNNSSLNDGFDMVDDVAGCGAHVWQNNVFGSSNDACIE